MHNALALANHAAIPSVGQVRVSGYTIVVTAECPCSPGAGFQSLVTFHAGANYPMRTVCPRCQSGHAITQIAINPENGELGFAFATTHPPVT